LSKVLDTYRDLRRYSQIGTILVRYGFSDLHARLRAHNYIPWGGALKGETKKVRHLSAPQRLRMAFEELGPTFIKLGQLMSTRADLLPPSFIEEMSMLQDAASPFPFSEARPLIEGGLNRPLDEAFLSIEEEPAAAASLAQVHRAITAAGDVVAVKVQRPDIERIVTADIRILYDLAGLAERHLAESRWYEPTRLVDEFARTIRRELDFVREGRTMDRFRRYFAGDPTVYIPAVYWNLSAPKLLTTEYIRGVKVTDLERIDAAGLDRKAIAVNGANFILREVFDFRFFHADPHPGNVFVLPGNVIAPVDFGMTGAITEETADNLAAMFVAVMNRDMNALVKMLRAMGWLRDPGNADELKLDLHDLIERNLGVALQDMDMRSILEEIMAVIRRYGLRLPPGLALMARALLVSEGVGRVVDPAFNILEHARPYARRLMLRRFDPKREARDLLNFGAEGGRAHEEAALRDRPGLVEAARRRPVAQVRPPRAGNAHRRAGAREQSASALPS
jgi:ubiquinone biosynthesis protein